MQKIFVKLFSVPKYAVIFSKYYVSLSEPSVDATLDYSFDEDEEDELNFIDRYLFS
jgi:hypothetical protein